MTSRHCVAPLSFALSATTALLMLASPAHALYKVVGPDGKVTYTDRPATSTDSKVQPVGEGGSVSKDVALPYEVRQVAQRYPVTLYVAPECGPCDAGRQLLRQRGVPYAEKLVSSADDSAALQRITGSSSLPAMTLGAQVVRGWQREEWLSYLDAAGYPKESKLPADFPQAKAEPLTETKSKPAPKPVESVPSEPVTSSRPTSGFRF